MAIDPELQTALLVHRFGLVPKAGGLSAAGRDARAALLSELEAPNAGLIADRRLLASDEAYRAMVEYQRRQRALRRASRDTDARPGGANPEMAAGDDGMQQGDATPKRRRRGNISQRIYREEARARFSAAFDAEFGFVERLVWFWSNHFCVSAGKGQLVRSISGAFEREAIRPHVTGKFADMLMAVESHPAMLLYLDNARSIGPNSPIGQRRGRGLNENLAREILELHTLGVNGGYTQADVTSFAKVITGWTVVQGRDEERSGTFEFNRRFHEPGPQRILGRQFRQNGVAKGRAVLNMLAQHPATAQHVARKLARHFVADNPPPQLVERLAKRFRDTDGDLKEVSKALLTAPEAAEAPRAKLRPPAEWVIGIVRAMGTMSGEIAPIIEAQNLLGQPLWRPPAPKGFPDDTGAWLDGIAGRLDIANQFARRNAARADVRAIADEAFGPLLTRETLQTLNRAESQQQALALLLMSPEFQRR